MGWQCYGIYDGCFTTPIVTQKYAEIWVKLDICFLEKSEVVQM